MQYKKIAVTGAESFWYVLQCIAFGAGYFLKIPAKKALVDFGLVPSLTGAESFWYVVMNIGFGAGYFAKISNAKALSEMPHLVEARIQAAAIPRAPSGPAIAS